MNIILKKPSRKNGINKIAIGNSVPYTRGNPSTSNNTSIEVGNDISLFLITLAAYLLNYSFSLEQQKIMEN